MENTFHIQWHITNFCNLRCRHCYQENFTPEKNLSFEELKKMFRNIEDFLKIENKKLVIDLTGGEIFLHKDWKKLVEMVYFSDFVLKTGIITNGFFLYDETIEFLKNFPEIEIKISSEGFDRETYEFYRGKGNFERFIEKLELMKKTGFCKILMFTITESNAQQIEKIFDFSKKYEFDRFVVERFIPWGNGKVMKNDIIKVDTWCKVIRFLFEKCNIEFNIETILPYRGFMVEIKEGNNYLYGAPCIVGKDGFAIMPDGDVYPCRRFPLRIGNLLQDEVRNIWKNSPILNLLRKRENLKGRCKECKINDCYGCRALVYSVKGDFLQEDFLCFFNCQ